MNQQCVCVCVCVCVCDVASLSVCSRMEALQEEVAGPSSKAEEAQDGCR